MLKRKRSEGHSIDEETAPSVESGRRFDAYIRGWMRDAVEPTARPPSALLPLTPVTSLLANPRGEAMQWTAASTAVDDGRGCQSKVFKAPQSNCYGTAVVYDAFMLNHVSPDASDFERPARLERTIDHLSAIGLLQCCRRLPAYVAKTKDLRRVHTRELIDCVDQLEFFLGLRSEKSSVIGQDLFASEHTSRAARMAAGCVIEAAKAVSRGEVRNAFALIRPPGHHAAAGSSSGFCLYNNIAIAARAAQEELVSQRVASRKSDPMPRIIILDWDVHHCDGTESIFYDDSSVLVISIHQYGSGCGHILRKTASLYNEHQPSDIQPTEDISIDDLAALLPDTDDNRPNLAPESTQFPSVVVAEAHMPSAEKRQRQTVDYNKLAATLDEKDDANFAALFGIRLSNDTSSTSSSPQSSAASREGRSDERQAARYAGDTVGLSVDDSAAAKEEDPFYPGTGHLHSVGGDGDPAAQGRNINIPWPTHGMGDLEYLEIIRELVLPVAEEFAPDLFMISSGFDSARGDLLGSMNLTASGYYAMTKLLAERFPRLVVALEGGYNVKNVALCSEAVMRALLEASADPAAEQLPRSRMLWSQTAHLISAVRETHAPFWSCFSTS